MNPRSFGSDNHCGVHPAFMSAIESANQQHAPSYGTDSLSKELDHQITLIFGKQAQAFAVFNGTGANILALKSIAKSPGAILCSETAHILVDECGAPEAIAGLKLIPVPTQNGKIEISSLEQFWIRQGDQHYTAIRAISITQPTEYGTVYSIEELQQISHWAKKHRIQLHIDGARLSNALYFLGINLNEFSRLVEFDVLSFGGTKNGMMMGELVVFPKCENKKEINYLRKHCLQLPSKTRFISAQFICYLKNELYLKIAEHSHLKAVQLAESIKTVAPNIKITRPIQSNAVFIVLPKSATKSLKDTVFFYIWDEKTWECRLMTHWDTTDSDISNFTYKLKELV